MKKIAERILSVFIVAVIIACSAPLSGIAGMDWAKLFKIDAKATTSTGGMTEINGHYYEFFTNKFDSFDKAEEYCETLGGHLAVIESAEENQLVYKWLTGLGEKNGFLGMREVSGKWVDVWGNELKYLNWASGEPNDEGGNEDVIHYFYKYTDGKWNDYRWGKGGLYSFICEWEGLTEIKSQHTVLEYKSLKAVSNATVDYNGDKLSIKADNFYDVDVSGCTLINSAIMMFAAVPESTQSHISAVHCNGFDALSEKDNVSFPITGTDRDDNKVLDIHVYSDLSSYQSIDMLQGGRVLKSSSDGHFQVYAGSLNVGANVQFRVVDSDGKKYNKIVSNIKSFKSETIFNLTDKSFDITLPDSLPQVLAGTKISFDLSKIPVRYIQTEDTLKIGIGYSAELGKKDDKSFFEELKKTVKDTKKDIAEGISTAIIQNRFQKFSGFGLGGSSIVSGGALGKINGAIAAYAEFKYTNGKWTGIGSEGFIQISGKISNEWQATVLYVPVVLKLSGEIGVDAEIEIGYDNDQISYNFDLDFTVPSVRGSAGIGIVHVVDGSVYLQLENHVKFSAGRKTLNCVLDGDLGISGKFIVFSGEKSLWKFCQWQYYQKYWGDNPTLNAYAGNIINSDELISNQLDSEKYSLDKRKYLEKQSDWLGEKIDSSLNTASVIESEKLLQSSIYDSSIPKVVTTSNGTTMMIWTADIAERTSGNQTAVVYSVYNSTNNTWSEPKIVNDDRTADGYPTITTDGNDIYVSWANSNATFEPETITVKKLADSFDVCVAKYNSENDCFEKPIKISNDSMFDFSPSLYAENGDVYVSYVSNDGNEPMMLNGKGYAHLVKIHNDDIISVFETASEKPIKSAVAGKLNGRVKTAYVIDEDLDVKTNDDEEIYINGEKITSNQTYEENATFTKIGGNDAIAYYSDGKVYYSFDATSWSTVQGTESRFLSPDFKFISYGNNTTLLVNTNQESKTASNVYGCTYNGEVWSDSVKMTESVIDIKNFDAYFKTDDTIGLVYTKVKHNETISETVEDGYQKGSFEDELDLYSLVYKEDTDLSLNSVYYDRDNVIPGETLNCKLKVTNSGMKTITKETINVSGLSKNYTFTLNEDLKPGETRDLEISLPIDSTLSMSSEYNFDVSCENDIDISNNIQIVKIGYSELSVSIQRLGSCGNTSAVINIQNNSCIAAGAKIYLRKDSYDGAILSTYNIVNVPAKSTKYYYLDNTELRKYYATGESIYIEIVSDKDEYSKGNNFAFFMMEVPTFDEYDYEFNDDQTIKIIKYNGDDTNVSIPEEIDGLKVSEIAIDTFAGCNNIIRITIPYTVKTIQFRSFKDCIAVKEYNVDEKNENYLSLDGVLYDKDMTDLIKYPVARMDACYTIPDTVLRINSYAFYSCKALTEIVIPDSVKSIGSNAFAYCNNVSEITLGKEITEIDDSAFKSCSNLETVNYYCTNCIYAGDYSISSPNRRAIFGYCLKLTNFNIGKNVTKLPTALLCSCSSIKNITIPQSVTHIENRAFYRCTGLENVYYEGTLDNWCGIVFRNSYSNPCYYADNLYCDGKLVSGDITIATDVNNYALYNSASITNVTLTDNVKKIGNCAFQKCTSLKNVTIPDNVTYIGSYAFSGDSNIESFSLPKSLTTIGNGAFQNCALIDDIVVPENVTNIGASAFYGCNNLQKITLPFVGTSERTTVSNSVFGSIFGSTSSSTSGTTKQSYDSLNSSYYYIPSTLKSVTITKATKIPYGAFDNCSMITDLSIPKSVASVGENAFRGCTGLKKLSIPFVGSSRTSTGYTSTFGYPFGYSSSSVDGYTSQYYESSKCYYYNIPSSIEDVEITDQSTIPYGAFYNCSKIKNIRLNKVITDISTSAFFGLSGMENVYFDGSIEEWCNINCTSYRPNYYANHLYINGELLQGELVIPSTITNVPSYAFAGATDISSIKLSSKLSSVGANAFIKCTGLSKVDFDGTLDDWVDIRFTNYASNPVYFAHDLYIGGAKLSGKIVLPERLNVVPNSVFAGCSGITEVILNDNITSIEQFAFDHCTNLAVINIPETITKICEYAFDGCSGLAEVTIPNGVTNVPRYAFRNCTSLKKLTVPCECSYKNDSFSGCKNIESMTLTCKNGIMPNFGTSSIFSSKSFKNTPWYISDAINEITIEDGVKRIGDNAFRGTHASKINVPTSVKEIGSNAFYNCSKLGEITIPAGTNSIGTSAFSNNTTIKCYKNSPAYLYAVENSLIYELLNVIFEKDSGNIRIDNAAKNVYGFVDGLSSLINDTTVSDGYTMSYDAAERVFTGMKIQIKDSSSNVVEEYSAVLFGDVNGDGWYDGRDAVTVSMIANGMLTREQVGEAVWMAADCNHDGKIDQTDVDLLNQAGLLLSSVDQTKPTEELLETSSEYNEYLNLIDQSVEVKSNEPKQEGPEIQKPSLLEFLLTTIWNYIKLILSLIK